MQAGAVDVSQPLSFRFAPIGSGSGAERNERKKIDKKAAKIFLRRKTIFSPLPELDCRDGIRTDNSPRGDGNIPESPILPD